MIQRPVSRAIGVEIRRRRALGPAAHGVDGVDGEQMRGVAIRERPQEQRIHDAEHQGVGTNPNREREQHHHRHARASQQQARGETEILERRVERRHAAAIAVQLLRQVESAQFEKRLTARLMRRHPGAQVVVGVHLNVGLELVAELTVAPLPAEQTTQPPHPGTQRSHDCSPADEAAPG